MANFDALIEAQLAGATVRCAPLVKFDFASDPVFLWSGFADLLIGSDTYKGIGNLGQISAIGQNADGAVEEMTFALFGEEGLLDHIREDAEESDGHLATVSLQFFDVRKEDEDHNFVDWALLGDPLVMFQGVMGALSVERHPPSESQRATRLVSVSAVSFFVNRARPPFAFWSDRQLNWNPDTPRDELLSRVSTYAFSTVRYPHFSPP